MTTILYHNGTFYSDSRQTTTHIPGDEKWWHFKKNRTVTHKEVDNKILHGKNTLLGFSGRVAEGELFISQLNEHDKFYAENRAATIDVITTFADISVLQMYIIDGVRYLDYWKQLPTWKGIWSGFMFFTFGTVGRTVYKRESVETRNAMIGSGVVYYDEARKLFTHPYEQMIWCGLNDTGSDTRIHKHELALDLSSEKATIIHDQAMYDNVLAIFEEKSNGRQRISKHTTS